MEAFVPFVVVDLPYDLDLPLLKVWKLVELGRLVGPLAVPYGVEGPSKLEDAFLVHFHSLALEDEIVEA